MKAHRWYSAFRNVGIWAICVVIAWVVIPGLIDYPQRYSALDLMSLIGLMVLPLAFLVGVIFPFRSEAEIQQAWREDDTEIGPLFIVRYGNHSNYVWIWFHWLWDKPVNIGSAAREVSPNIVFSSTIFPDCSGKVDPTRSKR